LDVFGFGPPHLRHKARAGKRPSGDQRVAVPHQGETVVSLWLVTKPRAWPRSRIVRHGNMRLQQALYLLKTDKIAEATPHLNAVAEDKTALETTQAAKDRKVAAVAYRNLGAIAGLADPKRALEAYEKAVALDPDDLESLVWIGEIQIDHGDLNEAQTRLERVLTLAKTDDQVGDVQVAQGDLAGALKSYRDGFALMDPLANSDPSNTGCQYEVGARNARIGDVQRFQGDLAGALKSNRDSLAIFDLLAKADPGNADWQRDLLVSFEKIGDVQVAQGDPSFQ
jgi:tetratricopeptide (TPR) repeat protein